MISVLISLFVLNNIYDKTGAKLYSNPQDKAINIGCVGYLIIFNNLY